MPELRSRSRIARALISILTIALFTGPLAYAKTKRSANLLKPREIRALKPEQKARYYRELHKILVTLESRQKTHPHGKKSLRKKTALTLFLETAFAQKEEGDSCLLGGYFGRWTVANGKAECANPEASQIWESDDDKFECGTTPSGEKKAYCNSAFFLYANDAQERMCEPATNLVSNCAKKFEERYLSSSSMDRLVADTAKLMDKMGPEEIEEYHRELDTYLGDMIAAEDDPETARILKKQVGVLSGLKMAAQKTGQAPGTEPVVPPKPPSGASEKSRLLGDELSCIRDGLIKVGIHPSEQYLAFLGAGIQASRGPFRTNDPESLKQFRAAVISMVQAYGVCGEDAYRTTEKAKDISKIRNLITGANGQATGSGLDYIGSALGIEQKERIGTLHDLFGVRDIKSLFPDANTWQTKNLVERQRTFTNWSGYGDRCNRSSLEKCQADAIEESKKPGTAFNIEALNRDNRRAAVNAAATNDQGIQKLYKVTEENLKVCGAMTAACGFDVSPVCDARNLVKPPGALGAPLEAAPVPGPPPSGSAK